MRINKAHEHLDASQEYTSKSPHVADSPLLKLPNELLIQITSLLAPNQRVDKNGGFGLDLEQRQKFPQETIALFQSHAQNIQDILNLNLTCKRLSDVAQDVLYKDVSLLQVRLSHKQKTNLALTCFLRTVIKRPDLAARVRHFAVWIWKNRAVRRTNNIPRQPKASQRDPDHVPERPKPNCVCETCFSKLFLIVNTTHAAFKQMTSWTRDIKATPSEATVCALILACLPNLRNVAIYAHPHPAADPGQPRREGLGRREYVNDASQPDNSDVVRLSYALNMAKRLKELTVSTHLNGLAMHARLPTLTSLTLDFSSSHPFVSVPKTSFRNVTHLAIRARLQDFHLFNELNNLRLEYPSSFSQKLGILLRNLPSVRTLEFESGMAVSQCKIPRHVEKVVWRPVNYDINAWLASIGSEGMKEKLGGVGLKTIEAWFRVGQSEPVNGREAEMLRGTRIKIVYVDYWD